RACRRASSMKRVRAMTDGLLPGQRRSIYPTIRGRSHGTCASAATRRKEGRRKPGAKGSSNRRSVAGRGDSMARNRALYSAVLLAWGCCMGDLKIKRTIVLFTRIQCTYTQPSYQGVSLLAFSLNFVAGHCHRATASHGHAEPHILRAQSP